MGYIGKQPTPVPLTASDVTDVIITSAKIADGTITSDDLASGVGGNLVKLSSSTASNSASITFDNSVITSTYKYYQIHCIDIVIATDADNLKFQISTDNGSSYITSSYHLLLQASDTGTTSNAIESRYATAETAIPIFGVVGGLGNAGNEVGNSIVHLLNPNSVKAKLFRVDGTYLNNNGELQQQDVHSMYNTTTAYNNVKIACTSGNITSGTFILYGVTA